MKEACKDLLRGVDSLKVHVIYGRWVVRPTHFGRWRLKTKIAYPREEVEKSDKLAHEFGSNFTLWLILQLHEPSPLIYIVRGLKLKWENSNEKHLNLAPIPSHKGSVTWFLSLAPPKSTPTPSFYVTWKVWLIFIHLHLLYLYLHLPLCSTKNYSKLITRRDIQWCLVGPDLLFVGLELKLELVFGLGLGLLLSWAWASSINNT